MGTYRGVISARRPKDLLRVAACGAALAVGLAGVGLARSSARGLTVTAASTASTTDWFTGVSCVSRSACTGVGSLEGPSGAQVVLAERWHDHRWSAQRIPSPSKVSQLSAVSCPSRRTCVAVGDYFRSSRNAVHGGYFGWGSGLTLAERWNARSWSIQHPVNPGGRSVGGGAVSALDGVSCASATSCTAVGSYFGPTRSDGGTIAEHWDGKRWSMQKTPASTGLEGSLNAVSCPSLTFCIAVGSARNRAVVERWNGTKWSRARVPEPPGTRYATLAGVDCVSTVVCVAVGGFTIHPATSKGIFSPPTFAPLTGLAERWNGKAWRVQRILAVQGLGLAGVSCASAHDCMAIEEEGTQTVRLRGTRWSTQSTTSPSGLSGVSCPARRTCVAVGSSSTGTLAERWNGDRWSLQQTPNPGL